MPPRFARLAGLGAFGVIGLFALLYILVIWTTLPTSNNGMTPVLDVVTWIAIGCIIGGIVVAHVAVGRQLLHIGRGGGATRV